jgi:hypothetical protein
VKINTQLLPWKKVASLLGSAISAIFTKATQSKQSPNRRKFAQSGVDVIITIFCDFYPFSAKKLAFFSKTNVMITIFAKTSFVLRQKRQFFR